MASGEFLFWSMAWDGVIIAWPTKVEATMLNSKNESERHAVLCDLTCRLMAGAGLDVAPPVDRSLSCALDSLGLLVFLVDVRESYHVELGGWLVEAVGRGTDTLDGLCGHLVAHAPKSVGSVARGSYG